MVTTQSTGVRFSVLCTIRRHYFWHRQSQPNMAYPRFILRTIKLIERNRTIQVIVETKPSHTSGSVMYQPRVRMDRSDVVANVNGRQAEMYCSTRGIPSTGQMTPKNHSKISKCTNYCIITINTTFLNKRFISKL